MREAENTTQIEILMARTNSIKTYQIRDVYKIYFPDQIKQYFDGRYDLSPQMKLFTRHSGWNSEDIVVTKFTLSRSLCPIGIDRSQ